MTSAELLPLIGELYSRNPEYRHLAAWELQSLLWSLGCADELEDEGEIAEEHYRAALQLIDEGASA
jgi:hypothetical protein